MHIRRPRTSHTNASQCGYPRAAQTKSSPRTLDDVNPQLDSKTLVIFQDLDGADPETHDTFTVQITVAKVIIREYSLLYQMSTLPLTHSKKAAFPLAHVSFFLIDRRCCESQDHPDKRCGDDRRSVQLHERYS